MNNQNSNPFYLPGFGQTGDLSNNPLLASMEMMGKAWQSLAGSGVLSQPSVSATLTTEDLDRRINDLRAVENWLRINMSMLTSSIQALEVQRATIATLKSFVNVPGAADSASNPSPLEVALGLKPSGQAKIKTPEQARDNPEQPQAPSAAEAADSPQAAPLSIDPAAMSDAAQGWWNMLQKQFDTLAAATVAGMQTAQDDAANALKAPASPRKTAGARTGAAKKAASANKAAPAAKRTPSKTTATKSASKRAASTRRS